MGTFTEDAATAQGLLSDLEIASGVVSNSQLTTGVLALAGAMAPFLSDPESINQVGANDIGEKMRAVDGLAHHGDAETAAIALHDFLSDALFEHFGDNESIDCDEASGGKPR